MELDNNLFQGDPLRVGEGPMNYYDSNKYIHDRRGRQTTCNRFIQIVKVIFYIELIIVIGWFGCVLISEYNSPRNYDTGAFRLSKKCQKFDSTCTVYEIDNANFGEKIKIENRREPRSINDAELARERCQRSINMTLKRFDDLANRVVIGEISDPNVVKLRQQFVQEMIFLTLHVIFVQSNDTHHAMNLTKDEWNSFAIGIKQALLNSADLEHRIQLEASGPLSQELTNEIHDTVESMASDYMNCETILPTPRLGNSKGTKQQALRLVEIVLERKRCGNSLNMTQEKLLALTTQIVTGESTDPVVIKLRKDAKNKLMSIPHTFLGDIRDEMIIKTGLANLTNANWHTILVELKKELSSSTDSQHQQQLEASGPPTPEMGNELRDIVEYFLIDHRKCEKLYANMLSAGKGGKKRQQARRNRRASKPVKYSTNDCLNDEKELLKDRRARLQGIKNADLSDDPTKMRTKDFLDAIEIALNSTNGSEVSVTDDLLQNDHGLIMWKHFLSNLSLEIKKEFYELVRDEFLELRKERSEPEVWKDYDLMSVFRNFTDSMSPLVSSHKDITAQDVLNIIVQCGKSLNFHYLEVENQNVSNDSTTPMFGTLVYLDEEPEKLGVQHMRHILNGYVRLFFRALNAPTPCNAIGESQSNAVTSEASKRNQSSKKKRSVAKRTTNTFNSGCRDKQQDEVLLGERQARLKEFANRNEGAYVLSPSELRFLNALETALNATNTSDINFDNFMQPGRIMPAIVYMMSNASLELHKECYELLRDLLLEFRKLQDHSPDWAGREHISDNLSSIMHFTQLISLQSIFDDFLRIGKDFDLRYVELENRNNGDKSSKPLFGHFTYIGEKPEPPGIRHTRHIFDGLIKVYFEGQSSSASDICDSDGQNERSMKKRSAPADLKPKPITTMCWSKEQETVLLEERRQRLEAFALNNASVSTFEKEIQKKFFNAIETALNATSTSEIRFADEIINASIVLGAIHYLVANASLELHKEGYELCRDLFIEMHKLNYNDQDWEGYNIDNIAANLSSIEFVAGTSMTAQKIFTNFVNFGKAFNLRYVELEIRDSEDEPNKLVFGKFINLGEKPEKSGVRNLRHILDGFVRFYFKTQYPSRPKGCNSRESSRADSDTVNTTTPDTHTIKKRDVTPDTVSKPVKKCRNQEEDALLLEERRERLEAFAKKNATNKHRDSYTQNYLNAIQAALNAETISEIRFDDMSVKSTPMLLFIQDLVANSSLELLKEGYEFSRDLYLEMLELRDRSPAWEGYDESSLIANITQEHRILFSRANTTIQSMFNDYIRFGEAFNLRYDEFETRNTEVHSNEPALGKFTYLGEEPEKLGSRRLRHILDGFVKFYFKTQNPSSLECNTSVQPSAEGKNEISMPDTRTLEKRSVSVQPAPAFFKKCWILEQDDTLLQERRERLEAFANRNATGTMRNEYMQNCLESIELALNATSVSEIHFDEDLLRSSPALMFMDSLAVNSSLELRKEGYEFARDLYLEMIHLSDGNPDWEGYDENTLAANISENVIFNQINITSESIFNDFIRFGQIFNLRYDELAIRSPEIESNKPVYGKFTYIGEEPEKLGVRRLRHILDSFVKVYFKIQNPSTRMICNPTVRLNVPTQENSTPTPEKQSVISRMG